jgi:hypothetical protein
MASAGHCGSLQEAIVQPATGASFGTVRYRAPFPATDALLIGDETNVGRIYTGGATGVGKPVYGAGNPVVGAFYCFSGSVTFETCSHKATDVDEQVCFPDGCTQHLVVLTGGTPPQNGDSGGPAFINGGGGTTVYIRGIIQGKATDNSKFYIHKWTTVRDSFGVTIVTAT